MQKCIMADKHEKREDTELLLWKDKGICAHERKQHHHNGLTNANYYSLLSN